MLLFQLQKYLAKWHHPFVKMVHFRYFCIKAQTFYSSRTIKFISLDISPVCGPNTYKITYEWTLRLPVSTFAAVALKSFDGKSTAKINF